MTINICFESELEFDKAREFVETDSQFYAEENIGWNMLVVDVEDYQDADINEKLIESELIEHGIENFYFETEYDA